MRRSIIILLLAATGCGFVDRVFGRDELHILRRNQGKWRALGIKDYSFRYQQTCYCAYTTPVLIVVRDDTVYSVQERIYQLDLVLEPNHRWPTIDSLFAWTERNMGYGYKLDITYDGKFHFPGRVVGDLPMAIDDEYTSTATNLVRVVK